MESIVSTYHRRRAGGAGRRAAATVRCGTTLDCANRGGFLDSVAAAAAADDREAVAAVVIDLRPVRFFDSAGLRALVSAIHLVHRRGGRIWLRCHPGPVASRLTGAGVQRLAPIDMACRRLVPPVRQLVAQVRPATPSL